MSSRRWLTAAGFLLGVVGPIVLPLLTERLVQQPWQPRRVYVPRSFIETSDALDRYLADHGRMPTAEEGLAALVPQYLPEVPLDPWTQQPYVYEPAADGQSAELLSYGADGKPGGDGADADISLRALSMGPPPPPADPTASLIVDASFLLTPLLAFAGAYRWRLATGVLSGATCFTGLLLAAIAPANVTTAAALLIALASGAFAVAGGALVLRGRRGSRPLAMAAAGVAWIQLVLLAR